MDIDFREGIFQFRWAVCEDGYKALSTKADGEIRLLEPASTRFRYYDPERDCPDLLHRFVNARSSLQGILEFTSEYGPLGVFADYDSGEALGGEGSRRTFSPEVPQNIAYFKSFQRTIRKVMKALQERDDAAIKFLFTTIINPRLSLGIDWDDLNPVKYFVLPASLSDYIELLVARELSGGIEWRKCANPKCNVTFPIATGRGTLTKMGVGTRRKETCGKPACKKAVWRLRQKGELGGGNG